MNRLQEFFSRRIYGVPVGVIAVLVAAVVLVVALRMKRTTDTTDTATTDDEPAGDATDSDGSSNKAFEASPTTPTVIAQPTEDTNDLWAGRARSWLMAHGSTPTDAQRVIAKYLNSEPLDAAEKALIDSVVTAIGYPPEPPELVTEDPDSPTTTDPETPVVTVPTGGGGGGEGMPATKQGTPPCHHTVINAHDNGPGELALLYYGSNAAQKVNRLEAANWELGNGPWAVGTNVKIPTDHNPVWFVATATVRGKQEIAAKNGVSPQFIQALNPGMNFPVSIGTHVRVN